jgi:hypothetical protein
VTRYYFLSEGCCLKVAVLFLWGALSDERTGLQFAVQSLNRRTRNHTLLPHLRLPQPEGPGSRIFILQEEGGPVIPPGTGLTYVASYDSQSYGGGILTLPPPREPGPCIHVYIPRDRMVQSKVKVTLRPTAT